MISVCIATYNAERYISDQITSILNELNDKDEVIISDDMSNDDTIKIISGFQDSRIKIFLNIIRTGPIRNFEKAINNATNDYIFLADQDDIWVKGKVKAMLVYLKKYDIVISDCKIVDQYLNELHPSYFNLMNSGIGIFRNLNRNTYLGCCMAFKKKILQIALPFPKDIPMHDIWLGFVSELYYNSYFLPKQLVLYRRHGANATTTTSSSKNSLFTKILFRWNLIKYIPILLFKRIEQCKRRL